MNKSKITLFLFIAVVISWLLWSKWMLSDNTKESINSPNVVSLQRDEGTVKTDNADSKNTAAQTSSEDDSEHQVEQLLQSPTEAETLTYLQVYRKNRQFVRCGSIIRGFSNNSLYDPVAALTQRLQNISQDALIQSTVQQSKAIKQHSELCLGLKSWIQTLPVKSADSNQTENNAEFERLSDQLALYLQQLKPQSIKEQGIADVLRLSQLWKEKFAQVLQVSKGTETENAASIAALRQQSGALVNRRQEIYAALVNSQDHTSLDEELNQLNKQVDAIHTEIEQLLVVDKILRQQVIADFNLVNDELNAALKSRDADVFYEAQTTLEMTNRNRYWGFNPYKDIGSHNLKEPFVEYVSPGDVIQQLTGVQNNDLFGLVIKHATLLYLCELGADCGPSSEWVKYHCFLSYFQLSALSCERNLYDFYRNHHLNSNQWQDVEFVLNIIRGLYEN